MTFSVRRGTLTIDCQTAKTALVELCFTDFTRDRPGVRLETVTDRRPQLGLSELGVNSEQSRLRDETFRRSSIDEASWLWGK